jgi:hypothetical protein
VESILEYRDGEEMWTARDEASDLHGDHDHVLIRSARMPMEVFSPTIEMTLLKAALYHT